MRTWPAFLLTLTLSIPASAVVTQPDGTVIPDKVGCDGGKTAGLGAVFACICDEPGVCNIGDPCPGNMDPNDCDDGQNATCETTLWHDWNTDPCIPENISGLDPQQDAGLEKTFRPVCPLTFTIESRGTAIFKNVFGWYNVTGSKPSHDDLHVMLDCNTKVGDKVVLDIQSEPAYTGGDIGFFLATPEDHNEKRTCANGNCCATIDRIKNGEGYVYYSQPQFNPDAAGADSRIHLLVYNSRLVDFKRYFAWEDMFGVFNQDFTDLVTSVEGIECSGGGLPCDTGKIGLCSYGITECDAEGNLICTQIFASSAEVCDAVDNDCDGLVDNGAICPGDEICHNGRCVGSCISGEFPCQGADIVCDYKSGLCVPEDCVDVSCHADQVCRGGECIAPCEGVVCPWGQTCIGDVCLDPCQGVACAIGQICRGGTCLDGCGQCSGATCESPLRCDTTTGECYDPSCDPECPENYHCSNGTCVDNCAGAICPGGVPCENGWCGGSAGSGGSGGSGGSNGIGGSGGSSGMGANGPVLDAGTDDAAPGGGSVFDPNDSGGCGCRIPGVPAKGGALLLALSALGLLFARRRR